jgi:hypothetical protein
MTINNQSLNTNQLWNDVSSSSPLFLKHFESTMNTLRSDDVAKDKLEKDNAVSVKSRFVKSISWLSTLLEESKKCRIRADSFINYKEEDGSSPDIAKAYCSSSMVWTLFATYNYSWERAIQYLAHDHFQAMKDLECFRRTQIFGLSKCIKDLLTQFNLLITQNDDLTFYELRNCFNSNNIDLLRSFLGLEDLESEEAEIKFLSMKSLYLPEISNVSNRGGATLNSPIEVELEGIHTDCFIALFSHCIQSIFSQSGEIRTAKTTFNLIFYDRLFFQPSKPNKDASERVNNLSCVITDIQSLVAEEINSFNSTKKQLFHPILEQTLVMSARLFFVNGGPLYTVDDVRLEMGLGSLNDGDLVLGTFLEKSFSIHHSIQKNIELKVMELRSNNRFKNVDDCQLSSLEIGIHARSELYRESLASFYSTLMSVISLKRYWQEFKGSKTKKEHGKQSFLSEVTILFNKLNLVFAYSDGRHSSLSNLMKPEGTETGTSPLLSLPDFYLIEGLENAIESIRNLSDETMSSCSKNMLSNLHLVLHYSSNLKSNDKDLYWLNNRINRLESIHRYRVTHKPNQESSLHKILGTISESWLILRDVAQTYREVLQKYLPRDCSITEKNKLVYSWFDRTPSLFTIDKQTDILEGILLFDDKRWQITKDYLKKEGKCIDAIGIDDPFSTISFSVFKDDITLEGNSIPYCKRPILIEHENLAQITTSLDRKFMNKMTKEHCQAIYQTMKERIRMLLDSMP